MLLSTTNAIGLSPRAERYHDCVAVCNAAAVACYASAGLFIGCITLGVGAVACPVAMACSNAYVVCIQGC